MLTKKWCVIFSIGLFMLLDMISTIILNMLFDNGYTEFLMDRPGIAVILMIIGIPCCYKYIKSNFGKEEIKEK